MPNKFYIKGKKGSISDQVKCPNCCNFLPIGSKIDIGGRMVKIRKRLMISLTETIKRVKSLNIETSTGISTIFVVIVLDMVFVYWYFQLKKLAISILFVSSAVLTIVLLLERGSDENMEDNKKKIKELEDELIRLRKSDEREVKTKKKEKNKKGSFMDDLGLPDPESYNKRLKEAYGDMGF